MPKITVNDISMHYEMHGAGEPLVLIAGFTADHTIWNSVIEQLATQYQVIVFDNRGAGQTDVPVGPYSIKQMSDDVAELCQQLKISQAHFIGNSMGGFILQMLCRHHPELIKSAIISNSANTQHTCYRFHALATLGLMKAKAPLIELIKSSVGWAFSYDFLANPENLEMIIQMRSNNPHPITIDGYKNQLDGLEHFDLSDWVNKTEFPKLIISSDQDLIFGAQATQKLLDSTPGAQHYGFENCAHLPNIERPDEFVKVVKEFITHV